MRFPATPAWGPPAAVVAVARFRGVGWGVSRVVCVRGAAPVRRVCACVCFVFSWCLCWSCYRCVFRVCWSVCVCVCVVCWGSAVACPRFPRLELAAGVGVDVTVVCCGWSFATPGGGS